MNPTQRENAQDKINEANQKLTREQIIEIWDDNRKTIIDAFSDDDIALIEKEHWTNIVLQHKERINQRKIREEE